MKSSVGTFESASKSKSGGMMKDLEANHEGQMIDAGKASLESIVDGGDSMQARFVAVVKKLRGNPSHLDTESGEEVPMKEPTLAQQMLAEAIGTGFIVFGGVGSVNAAELTGSVAGLQQVAMVWAVSIALAILATASISGAHLNPAVSFAFALLRPEDFPIWKLPFFWAAQFGGAVLTASINLLIYGTVLERFEQENGIIRGEPGSERSAMVFGEYFPNPGFQSNNNLGWTSSTVTPFGSMGIEAWGTGILMFVILALIDPRNQLRPSGGTIAFGIGLTVFMLISLYAPLNQAGFNPARDFGPRIVAYFAGFDDVAFIGWWIYVVGPMIGAPLGGMLYDVLYRGL